MVAALPGAFVLQQPAFWSKRTDSNQRSSGRKHSSAVSADHASFAPRGIFLGVAWPRTFRQIDAVVVEQRTLHENGRFS